MSQLASTAERSTRANFIQKKIDEIYQDLEEHDRFKKDKIHNLAGYYKEQVALGELKIELKDIAKQILKEIENRGIDISKATVYGCVPDDCKNAFEKGIVEGEEKSNFGLSDYRSKDMTALPPSTLQEEMEKLDKDLDKVNELKRRMTDDFNKGMERAKKEKIALTIPVPKDPNSTPMPEARVTKFSEAIHRGIEKLQKLEEKATEFPPDTEEEEYYAGCVDSFFSIFDPLIDEKWSTDWISPEGWLMAEKENVIQSKHHAGKKFGVETISGKWRHLTREQVGDKYPEVADKVVEFYNAVPGIIGFNHWYLTKVKPRIGERKTTFVNPRWS